MTWDASRIDGPIPNDAGQYLLNVAPECADGCEAYAVTPATPTRTFCDAPTVFFVFADEAEARSVLGAYWADD